MFQSIAQRSEFSIAKFVFRVSRTEDRKIFLIVPNLTMSKVSSPFLAWEFVRKKL